MNAKIQTILLSALTILLGVALNTQSQASRAIATVGQLAADDHEQIALIRSDISSLRFEIQNLQANGTEPGRDVANQVQALQQKADQISAAQDALVRRLRKNGALNE